MLMATVITVKQYLKRWVATIISAPVHCCQNKILKGDKKREMDELIREY